MLSITIAKHVSLTLKQARQQRDQRGANENDAAACHELLHALGLGARVIRAVALQQIDHTPYAKASAESDNEGL